MSHNLSMWLVGGLDEFRKVLAEVFGGWGQLVLLNFP